MKVLFDRRSTAGQKSGVGFYASGLLDACARVSAEHAVHPFPDGPTWAAYRVHARLAPIWWRWRSRARTHRVPRLLMPLLGALRLGADRYRSAIAAALRRQLRARVAKGGYDLYHELNFLPLEVDLPTVITIHDLSVLRHPEWHPVHRVQAFDLEFFRGVRQARHLITVSETVRRQVIRLLNVPPSRVTSIHNGTHPGLRPMRASEAAAALRGLGLRPGYLLHVGTVEPRKNLLLLMQAYCSLPRRLRERCPLVLVGGWGWRFEDIATYYFTHARHHGVHLLGYVPTRHLAALYNGARALVCPSLDEGFGLPAVEMLACGGAVLASDIEVFRETVGGRALLVPSEDSDAWRRAMTEVILDDDLWHLLRLGGVEAARKYRWEECATRTLEVYRAVAEESLPTSRVEAEQIRPQVISENGCRPGRHMVRVVSPSGGIGDHLLALSVAEGYRRQHPGCAVVFASRWSAHPWLKLFGGHDQLVTLASPQDSPTEKAAVVLHCDNTGDWQEFTARGKPRWQFWGEKFNVRPTSPGVRDVPAEAEQLALPHSHCIAIAPFAAFPERTWALTNWLEVERQLAGLGFRVVILDDRADRCHAFRAESKLLGRHPAEVVAVIRGSLCVVGNDSGMCHVAGASGVRGVAVCADDSDRNIMGLWPTVLELGGCGKGGNAAVRPDDVVRAVLAQVQAGVTPAFPTQRFLASLLPEETSRRHCWPPIYAVLWQTLRELAPRRIVEIGTGAGVGTWTILEACPTGQVHTIAWQARGAAGREIGLARRRLAGRAVTFQAADPHTTLERVPECDLCLVAGDPSADACYRDCWLAERSGAKTILVDHYTTEGVREGVARFLREHPHRRGRSIRSQTGLYLMERTAA